MLKIVNLFGGKNEEKEKTGIQTLKIKYNNAAGYFIEVSKGKISCVPSHFIMRRALVNGDRYTTARLQELEHELNEAGTRILELERDLFLQVRDKLHDFVPYLIDVSAEIAYVDATSSFAPFFFFCLTCLARFTAIVPETPSMKSFAILSASFWSEVSSS